MMRAMAEASRLDRGGDGTHPASPAAGPSSADPHAERAFFRGLAVVFFALAALVHALVMGLGVVFGTTALPIARHSPGDVGIVEMWVTRLVTLLPAIGLVLALDRRFGLFGERGSTVRAVAAILGVATVEWWLFLATMLLVDRWRGIDTNVFIPGHAFGIGYRVMVLGVGIMLFSLGAQWRRVKSLELRAAEAEAALRTSELRRLESQLQPHFLFNALTAVLACRHDPEAVADVTLRLSEHLRSCLSRQRTLEPLSREIDALEHYLAVQRARFGRRLDCRITCSAEARDVPVPPVIVEPLLDNAFKHGGGTSPEPLRIVIDCRMEETTLVVTVDNSGTWIEPGADGRQGTGLANLRRRLELLDVHDASLESGPVVGGVRARLRLPPVSSPPASAAMTAASTGGGER